MMAVIMYFFRYSMECVPALWPWGMNMRPIRVSSQKETTSPVVSFGLNIFWVSWFLIRKFIGWRLGLCFVHRGQSWAESTVFRSESAWQRLDSGPLDGFGKQTESIHFGILTVFLKVLVFPAHKNLPHGHSQHTNSVIHFCDFEQYFFQPKFRGRFLSFTRAAFLYQRRKT